MHDSIYKVHIRINIIWNSHSITLVNKDAVTTLRRRDQDFTGKHEQINLCDQPDEQIVIVETTVFIVVIFNTLQFGLTLED